MRATPRRLVLTFALLIVPSLLPLGGPAATMQQAVKRAIELEDIINWKSIGATVVSNDGSGSPIGSRRAKVMRRSSSGARRGRRQGA